MPSAAGGVVSKHTDPVPPSFIRRLRLVRMADCRVGGVKAVTLREMIDDDELPFIR